MKILEGFSKTSWKIDSPVVEPQCTESKMRHLCTQVFSLLLRLSLSLWPFLCVLSLREAIVPVRQRGFPPVMKWAWIQTTAK